ncbi:hypothetical protein BDV19DRAFT_383732 [Aspergillus venezuelensis]
MATTSETTPLLADPEASSSNEHQVSQDGAGVTTIPAAKPPYFRAIVVLTHFSAALSILAFICLLTIICIGAAGPGGFYLFYRLRENVQILLGLSILTLIISSLNLLRLRHAQRQLWLLVNLIVDAILIVNLVTTIPAALDGNFDQNPDTWLPDKKAYKTAQAVIVILGIGLVSSLIIGLAHLALLPLRCYTAAVGGGWDSWRVPGGEFRIEVAVKFLRQEDGTGTAERQARVAEQ